MKEHNKISQEFLETVEHYYNNTMPVEDRIIFESKLQNDSEFKTQVEDLKLLFNGIESQAFKEQLDLFHNDIPKGNKSSKVRFLSFAKMGIAAAIIIAIGLFWMNSNPSNEQIYAKNFTPDPGLPTTMSTTSNYTFFDAMVNYKQGDYKTAIAKWTTLEQKSSDNDTLQYFLGVAHLAENNTQKAIPYLTKTVNNTKSVFFEDATFYLGLAYLKEDNIRLAKETLAKSKSEKNKTVLDALK